MVCFSILMLVQQQDVQAGDLISTHNRQDMALQSGLNLCRDKNGSGAWSQTQPFLLKDDPVGYRVYANELLIVCTIKKEKELYNVLVSWTAPTTNEDGSTLLHDQVDGYIVVMDGVESTIQKSEAIVWSGVSKGTHSFSFITVMNSGVRSKQSVEVIKTIE